MKRFIAIILSLVILSAAFCGCKSADKSNPTASRPQKEAEKTNTSTLSQEKSLPEESSLVESAPSESKPIESKPQDTADNTEKLTLEKINQIKKEYFDSMGYGKECFDLEKIEFEHYATLSDGSMVIHIHFNPLGTVNTSIATDIVANEYYYTYYRSKEVRVYKNGKFAKLSYAYNSGLISKAVVDELYQKCPQILSKTPTTNNAPTITDDPSGKTENYGNLDVKIVEKIKAKYLETNHIATSKKLIITAYYGTFSDGSVAVRLDKTNQINSSENVYKHIGKYWCKYASKLPVMIYKNNELYELHDAYAEGVISDKILDEFFKKNPSLNGNEYYQNRLIARKKQLQDWLNSPTATETRSYWKGTTSEDYVGGEILIMLTLEASKKNFYKEYTPSDFPEIDCESVRPLGDYQREGIITETYNDESVGTFEDLNLTKFRRMFVITLKEKTKQAVYDGIHALDNRNDILSASPDYIEYLD